MAYGDLEVVLVPAWLGDREVSTDLLKLIQGCWDLGVLALDPDTRDHHVRVSGAVGLEPAVNVEVGSP